ncbi:MAG: hypothetical protein ACFFDN_10810 [Candidatus Hodarchaeota archaeon]
MNDKLNPALITIFEQIPGKFMAKSALNNEMTAQILMNLAINFYKQAAIEKYNKELEKQGWIINPHTMKPMKGI